jgi:peptidoglycan/LPS O-acetylase OafA/YrhL
MAQANTIQETMQRAGGVTTGFDYLRIGLAVAVLVWHSMPLSTGQGPGHLETEWWTGPLRFLPAAILPMFFALSGFLVAGSLGRTRLHQFVTLRVVRLIPALAVEIVLSALILGPILTSLPRPQYFANPQFHAYFLNIVGSIHYNLPGVFQDNPFPGAVNGQLWTIPFEMECYLALVLLSVFTLLKRRRAFALVVAAASVAITVRVLAGHPVDTTNHVPGRMLVLCFLAAVSLYSYRDVIPYSRSLGTTSAIAAAALLQEPNLSYLAAFPIAYLTVWLGLTRPPAIPFGDLSYGVYLFHFPIEQTVVHLFPGVRSWWLLTLVALPLTTACAWLSWNLIEKPTLVRKKRILAAVDQAWATLTRLRRPAPWRTGNETPTDPDVAVPAERN